VISLLTDIATYPFLGFAFLTGILASIACGIIGSFVVVKRISTIAGAIAHCTLGGMGLVYYLKHQHGIDFVSPIYGALIAALFAAVIIGVFTIYGKQREDTLLSALWSVGMAIGIFFVFQTSGYNQDLMSYLFGNILMTQKSDIFFLIFLDLLICLMVALFYNKFQMVCFDEEFSKLRGVHPGVFYILLLCLTAITVVALVRVVGIILVIALLTLPAAIAAPLVKRLWHMMILAVAFCMVFTVSGLYVSYEREFPAGPHHCFDCRDRVFVYDGRKGNSVAKEEPVVKLNPVHNCA